MTSRSYAALASVVLAACGTAVPDAASGASCERAVDALLALYRRQPDSLLAGMPADAVARDRAAQLDNCAHRPWDDDQRRCFIAAGDLASVIKCQIAADRRRHPEWPWAPATGD